MEGPGAGIGVPGLHSGIGLKHMQTVRMIVERHPVYAQNYILIAMASSMQKLPAP